MTSPKEPVFSIHTGVGSTFTLIRVPTSRPNKSKPTAKEKHRSLLLLLHTQNTSADRT
jgi:hypothetical protein